MTERGSLLLEWPTLLIVFLLCSVTTVLIGPSLNRESTELLLRVELVGAVCAALFTTGRLRLCYSDLKHGTTPAFMFFALLIGLVASAVTNINSVPDTGPQALTLAAALDTIALAPLIEELLFRGYLLWSAGRAFGTTVGIALSAILFGLVHLPGGMTAALSAVLVGVLFASMTINSKSLVPAVIGHVSFNLLAFVLTVMPVVYRPL